MYFKQFCSSTCTCTICGGKKFRMNVICISILNYSIIEISNLLHLNSNSKILDRNTPFSHPHPPKITFISSTHPALSKAPSDMFNTGSRFGWSCSLTLSRSRRSLSFSPIHRRSFERPWYRSSRKSLVLSYKRSWVLCNL